MPLKLKEQAPDFSLPSTSGADFTLSKNAANKPVIIYFYPKDFTPGCTKEACGFRDTFNFFKELNIMVIGISRDSVEIHHEFKKAHDLPFELLSDENGKVSDLYKTSIPLIKFTKRITYLLDRQHKIAAVYENFFGATKHIHEMVDQVSNGKPD